MVTADPATWAEETFGGCDLGDRRRVRRLVTMAASLAEHSGKSLLGACGGTPAELEGTYRFVESEHVVGSAIRDGGFDATMKQVADFEVLLAVEDSAVLSYSHAPEGTGDLGGPAKTTSRGLWVHSALFVDPSTQLTVGLADQQWWVRPERKGKKAKATYEKRESVKWQRCSERMAARLGEDMSRVISVCDRESDVWEYLAYKLSLGQRFVVRSSSSRLLEGDGERLLEDEADSWWPEHEREVMVPQKGGRKQRKVTLEVAAAQVTLKVPSDRDPTWVFGFQAIT